MAQPGAYFLTHIDTTHMTGADSTQLWSEHVCQNHGALNFRFKDPAAFRGGTLVQRHGDRQLIEFWSDAMVYSRSTKDISRDDDDTVRLLLPITGTLLLRQDEDAVKVAPGQVGLVTKARPFDIAHTVRAKALVMNIPNGGLSLDTAAGPAVFDRNLGLGSVVGGMIRQLHAQRATLDGPAFVAAYNSVVELLPMCLLPRPELPDTLAAVEAAVRDYVRRNAADPDLTPAAVAAALGWSLRQVQLALRHGGTTPARLLRTTRLDLARSLLHDPANPRTVADIAHRSGFRSLNTFGVAFKARFGATPQEYRAAVAHRPGDRAR